MLYEECEDLGYEDLMPDLQKITSAGTHLLSLINTKAKNLLGWSPTINIEDWVPKYKKDLGIK